jgi:hypothetical protein
LADQADGSVVMSGSIEQSNAPETWVMPLPVLIKLGDKQFISTTLAAKGAKNAFSIKLPRRPQDVELDPQHWVLSESTSRN